MPNFGLKQRDQRMLKAYMDESGIHGGARICAIGGWVATEAAWNTFCGKWSKVLASEGVSAFHMNPFEQGEGDFTGWSKERKHRFLGKLIRVIQKCRIQAVGSALVTEEYAALSQADRIWMTHDRPDIPYYLPFQHCIVEAAHRADRLPNSEKIDFIFDRQEQFGEHALEIFNAMSIRQDWDNHIRLGTISFSAKTDFVPLQAADLMVHECYKHLENKLYNPDVGERWPMRQIRPQVLYARYFDQKTFRDLLEKEGRQASDDSKP